MSAAQVPPVAAPRCADCRHFSNAPELLERRIPGLKVMGSGYSAVRTEDGLCALHDRYLSAGYRCASFASRFPDQGSRCTVSGENAGTHTATY